MDYEVVGPQERTIMKGEKVQAAQTNMITVLHSALDKPDKQGIEQSRITFDMLTLKFDFDAPRAGERYMREKAFVKQMLQRLFPENALRDGFTLPTVD